MLALSSFRFQLLATAAVGMGAAGLASGEPLPLAASDPPRAAAVRPAPGVEIQYELLTPLNAGAGASRLEGSVSGANGQVRSSVLVNSAAAAGRRVDRLDTSWQTRAPGPLQTLVVGDTFGSGGGWSRPVRFGGIRFGRDLALRPGFVAMPAGGVPGAALPTTALASVGAATDRTRTLIRAVPVGLSAAHQPPVAGPAVLNAGASDYEVEAGRLRTGWATADDRYGEGYAAAAYRAGLGAQFTAEARAEWTPSRSAAGVEMSRSLGAAGSVRAVLAQSDTADQSGLRWGMGMVGNSEGAAWMLSWDGFDRGYTALAASSGEASPRRRVHANATLPLGRGASAAFDFSRQTTSDSVAAGVLAVSARFPLTRSSSLSMKYTLHPGPQPGWDAGVTLAVPFGGLAL